jgi:hypothetical protein
MWSYEYEVDKARTDELLSSSEASAEIEIPVDFPLGEGVFTAYRDR